MFGQWAPVLLVLVTSLADSTSTTVTLSQHTLIRLHPAILPAVPSLWKDGTLHVEVERGGRNVTLKLHQRVSRFAGPRTHKMWWLEEAQPAGFDSTGGACIRVFEYDVFDLPTL